jgi:4-amino-4-deoxy-L-arabinose transferase-like glycosyltransferase
MLFFEKYKQWSWILLLVPIYLFLFLKLGNFHIRLWDESWFAVNAFEMLERDSWFVPFFNGEAIHYGSKPPLQTWLQFMFIKLIGFNELALRLPSALAAASLVLVVFHFVKRSIGQKEAWAASLVLLTTTGFVHFHAARGMESDSVLTLFLFLQAVFFYSFLKTKEGKYLILLGLFVGLAFLTKAIAGFFLLPGFLVYLVLFERKRITPLLKSKELYLAIGLGVAISIGFVLYRESLQPGYVEFLFQKQIGRFSNQVGHDRPVGYYFDLLSNKSMAFWAPLALLGLVFPFVMNSSESRPYKFASIMALTYFLVISFSRSKLEWYAMPMYPFLAISSAFPIALIIQKLSIKFTYLGYALLFTIPCYRMFYKTQQNKLSYEEMQFESQEIYLHRKLHSDGQVDGMKVIHNHFYGSLLAYKYMFQNMGQTITLQNNTDLSIGDMALVNDTRFISEIHEKYQVDTLDSWQSAFVFNIKAIEN